MEKYVTDQLIPCLRAGMFSICLDKTTDVTSAACLAVFAKFSFVNIIKKELIKLMTLHEKSRSEDIMNELKREFIELGITLEILYL